jgi:glyoxylase-like metal-dependent hydrolase (beta-lactamase superfamily II)
LRGRLKQRLAQEQGLLAIGSDPTFAIDQRALLIPAGGGNILWECVTLMTDEGIEAIRRQGGASRIVISHPHFYATMVDWSEALGGISILLHEADREWIQRPSRHLEFWSGDRCDLGADVTLIRCGGHFPGSTALHWSGHPGGALFPGDALQVTMDRRHVTFMYSYPNYIPMRPRDVEAMRYRLRPFEFADLFGYTWGRNIIGGARAAVDASFERYLAAVLS